MTAFFIIAGIVILFLSVCWLFAEPQTDSFEERYAQWMLDSTKANTVANKYAEAMKANHGHAWQSNYVTHLEYPVEHEPLVGPAPWEKPKREIPKPDSVEDFLSGEF